MRMGQIARQIGVSREAPLLRFVTRCRPNPSYIVRVDPDDLASVSPIVRPVSRNVRRCAAPVSANVRRKRPLIARPPQFDCAPLHLSRWKSIPSQLVELLRNSKFLQCPDDLYGVEDEHAWI